MEVIPSNSCRRAGSKSGKGKPVITENWGSVPLGNCVSQGQSEGRNHTEAQQMGLYPILLARTETLGNQLRRKKERMPKNPLGVGMQQGAQIQVQKKPGGETPPQELMGGEG